MTSFVAEPAERLEGRIRVPGDKSISHRALMVAAMGYGRSSIEGLSPAADVASTRSALQALGVRMTLKSKGVVESPEASSSTPDTQVLVDGRGIEAFEVPETPLDVGNSGSTIRMMLGILAAGPVTAELTGDESIRRRPMRRVVEPLRAMGAEIDGEAGADLAPLRVAGRPLHGAEHRLSVASAQIKSALLFAGLHATGTTGIEEPARSRDHTERMLRYLGVQIDEEISRLSVRATRFEAKDLAVPGDLSSAAFLLVGAAVLPGSHLSVHGVGLNPSRSGLLDVLRAFGAAVEVTDQRDVCGEPVGTIVVRAGDRRPVEVSGDLTVRSIDELPLVAILGAVADGETVVADAAELRVKESDRIATTAAGLRALGVDARETPDGFVVRGTGRLGSGTTSSAGDHRIAMAMAVAGLAADGPVAIEGWEAVGVSYPGFAHDLGLVTVR